MESDIYPAKACQTIMLTFISVNYCDLLLSISLFQANSFIWSFHNKHRIYKPLDAVEISDSFKNSNKSQSQ